MVRTFFFGKPFVGRFADSLCSMLSWTLLKEILQLGCGMITSFYAHQLPFWATLSAADQTPRTQRTG
jgi:hypothetical protein